MCVCVCVDVCVCACVCVDVCVSVFVVCVTKIVRGCAALYKRETSSYPTIISRQHLGGEAVTIILQVSQTAL